jgi:ZIP family zinc transporter
LFLLTFLLSIQLLNQTVTWLLGGHHHNHHIEENERRITESGKSSVSRELNENAVEEVQQDISPHCPCHADDPVADLKHIQDMAAEIDRHNHETNQNNREEEEEEASHANENTQDKEEDHKKLMRMSLNTALAIGLHNFPEGLATFVATLSDPSVGAVLAVAIAIHNIPEGLCVAMPIYYATGDKLKAFGWAMVSGIAEPIAALLGWAVLANSFSDLSYAILFGIVAGMMVIISARELLPTAHRYDPEDSVVTYSFMIGMAIMAISLVLFII